MSNKDKKAFKSHLKNLMMHIIKWYSEPLMRCKSWIFSIKNARKELSGLKDDHPSLNDDFVKEIWDETLEAATKKAEQEMEVPATKTSLTFDEVFKHPYTLSLLALLVLAFFITYTLGHKVF